jgi:hypothetical protein
LILLPITLAACCKRGKALRVQLLIGSAVVSRQENTGKTLQQEFMLREHEALQEKMSRSAADLWRIEAIVPLAIAALCAWLAKEGGQVGTILNWLLWIPVGLVGFGFIRQEIRYRYIDVVEDYLIRMEKSVYGKEGDLRGWENHWKARGSHGNRHTRRLVWAILLLATVAIAANGSSLYEPKARVAPSAASLPAR